MAEIKELTEEGAIKLQAEIEAKAVDAKQTIKESLQSTVSLTEDLQESIRSAITQNGSELGDKELAKLEKTLKELEKTKERTIKLLVNSETNENALDTQSKGNVVKNKINEFEVEAKGIFQDLKKIFQEVKESIAKAPQAVKDFVEEKVDKITSKLKFDKEAARLGAIDISDNQEKQTVQDLMSTPVPEKKGLAEPLIPENISKVKDSPPSYEEVSDLPTYEEVLHRQNAIKGDPRVRESSAPPITPEGRPYSELHAQVKNEIKNEVSDIISELKPEIVATLKESGAKIGNVKSGENFKSGAEKSESTGKDIAR